MCALLELPNYEIYFEAIIYESLEVRSISYCTIDLNIILSFFICIVNGNVNNIIFLYNGYFLLRDCKSFIILENQLKTNNLIPHCLKKKFDIFIMKD